MNWKTSFLLMTWTFLGLLRFSTQNISVCQSCTAQLSSLNHSVNVVQCPANCWSQAAGVCGSGPYTSGSICRAAMHAGVVSNSGGIVTVYKTGLANATGNFSYGINSSTCPGEAEGYNFQATCETTGDPQYGVTSLRCPANCAGQAVCGSGPYASSSSICVAAIHAGVITNAGGNVRIIRRPGLSSYAVSTQNGVTSQTCATSSTSFIFNNSLPTDECQTATCGAGSCTQAINAYYCSCDSGYTGTNCETDIVDCVPNLCQNGGNCTDLVNDYKCSCSFGYDGKNCSNYIGKCFIKPCQFGGTCVNGTDTNYTCICMPGYDGINCENDINECDPNPCVSGGTCDDHVNSYTCTCPKGYSGPTCANTDNECASFPCLNGGTCQDLVLAFNCTCLRGYNGTTCEIALGKCHGVTCLPNGVCDSETGSCKCKPGYSATPPTGIPTSCDLRCAAFKEANLTFPETSIGSNVFSIEKCRDGRAEASASCAIGKDTGKPTANFTNIVSVPCTSTTADVISSINVTDPATVTTKVVETSLTQLAIVATSAQNTSSAPISASDTQKAIDILLVFNNTDASAVAITANALYDSIAVVSVLAVSVVATGNQTQQAKQSNQLVSVLQDFSRRVVIPPSENTVTLSTTDISLQVTLPVKNSLNQTNNVTLTPSGNKTLPIGAVVPGSLIDSLATTYQNVPRVTFIVFLNDTLFKQNQPSKKKPTTIITIEIGTITDLPPGSSIVLTYKQNLTYGEGKKDKNNPTKAVYTDYECGGWDQITRTFTKLCTFHNGTTEKKCLCNKVGSLSLLFQSEILPSSFIQEWFSTIGLSVSSLGLFLTIIIYSAIPELRIRQPSIFLINICICLLATNLIFLLGLSNVKRDAECYATTVLLHYFLLAAWCWMTSNGYNMYRALVQVMSAKSKNTWKFAALFSYVLPLVVVGVTAGVTLIHLDPLQPNIGQPLFQSTYRARNMCWLQTLSLRYSFIIPVGIMAIANLLFCSSIIVHLTCKRGAIQSSAAERTTSHDMIVAVTLVVMLGVTWLFGFLMLVADNKIYLEITSWIFCIFNVFQGFLIFILNCVRQDNVRALWLHPMMRCLTCGNYYAPKPTTSTKSTSSPYTSQVNSSKI